jgi:hypothetical protein
LSALHDDYTWKPITAQKYLSLYPNNVLAHEYSPQILQELQTFDFIDDLTDVESFKDPRIKIDVDYGKSSSKVASSKEKNAPHDLKGLYSLAVEE